MRSGFLPEPETGVGHFVHKLARHSAQPDTVFGQKHWDVMRSVSVVPTLSDEQHYPPDERLRVSRSRTGGHEWEPLTGGSRRSPASSTWCGHAGRQPFLVVGAIAGG